jgi:YHS domain-containing protein
MRKDDAGRPLCTIGLALGKDVQTDYSVNATIDGKTYCFGNEAAKTEFMKDAKGNMAKAEAYYEKKH